MLSPVCRDVMRITSAQSDAVFRFFESSPTVYIKMTAHNTVMCTPRERVWIAD